MKHLALAIVLVGACVPPVPLALPPRQVYHIPREAQPLDLICYKSACLTVGEFDRIAASVRAEP